MAITAYQYVRDGLVTIVTVTSSLGGVVYFHWYADGAYVGRTTTPSKTFILDDGEQLRIEAVDTNDENYDGLANAPPAYPARRLLRWHPRSGNRIEVAQTKNADPPVVLGQFPTAPLDPEAHTLLTGRLADLSNYTWTMAPINRNGNTGISTGIGPEKIVRWPDAPNWTFTYDAGTTRVTFQAA